MKRKFLKLLEKLLMQILTLGWTVVILPSKAKAVIFYSTFHR